MFFYEKKEPVKIFQSGGGVNMEDIMNALIAAIAVAGFMGAIFKYSVLKPLYGAIDQLSLAIIDLRREVRDDEEKRQEMAERLIKVELSTKCAHHRIDEILHKEGRGYEG